MLLFIIKKFYDYNGYHQVANGLKTSAGFVVDLLKSEGFKAKLVEAVDGNCIDRLVTEFKPSICILEALWVTPEKLAELRGLHPKVKFVVRIHSEMTFLAQEGISIEWLDAYVNLGVTVAFNSKVAKDDFKVIGPSEYLPNYYPVRKIRRPHEHNEDLHVGCFGAIRPLKNQLVQALAAIRAAECFGDKLVFHMNGTRQEQGGNNNLKSIKAAIEATGNELVLHDWLPHEEFLELICKMDVCLQVSLSESFCIVASDAVSMGVPLIGSSAIRWLPRRSQAPVDNSEGVARKIIEADRTTVVMNHEALKLYLEETVEVWNEFVERHI